MKPCNNKNLRIDLIKADIPVTCTDAVYIDTRYHAHINNKEYFAKTTNLLITKIKNDEN